MNSTFFEIQNLTSLAIAFLITALLIPVARKLAERTGVLSVIDYRRVTAARIPLLGGVALFAGWIVGIRIYNVAIPFKLLITTVPIFAMGLLDDQFELRAKSKFILQTSACIAFVFWSGAENLVLSQTGLPSHICFILTCFWMVGAVNAFNMIDGLDGLAGSVGIMTSIALYCISRDPVQCSHLLVLASVCAAFLLYNRPPATIYLGDCGSTTIGFILAATACTLPLPISQPGAIWLPLFIFAYPLTDACLSIARRARKGRSISVGDRDHLHHSLEKLGLDKAQRLTLLIAVNLYCCIVAYAASKMSPGWPQFLLVALSVISLLSLLGGIYFIRSRLRSLMAASAKFIIRTQFEDPSHIFIQRSSGIQVRLDLLPYCREMHGRSLDEVDRFIKTIANYLSKNNAQSAKCNLMWDESLMISIENADDIPDLLTNLKDIFSDFKVALSADPIPVGVEILGAIPSISRLRLTENHLDFVVNNDERSAETSPRA